MPTPVQTARNSVTTGTTCTVTLGTASTAGNTLVAVMYSGATSVSGITLTGSTDTWASRSSVFNASVGVVAIWSDPGCAGGHTSIVVTQASSQAMSVIVYELPGNCVLDQAATGNASAGGTTGFTAGTMSATTSANEFWIGVVGGYNGAGTAVSMTTPPGGSWVNQAILTYETYAYLYTSYQSTTSTGTPTYTGTTNISGTANNSYGATMATFVQAATGVNGTAALTAAGSLTAAGVVDVPAAAALTAAGTMAAAAAVDVPGTATLTASGSLAAGATQTSHGAASLVATSTLAATGANVATLTATSTLAAGATQTSHGAAALAASGTLTAGGTQTSHGAATLAATGTLAAAGYAPGAATLAASGSLTAAATQTSHGTAALAASASLAAAATGSAGGAAALSASSALTAASPQDNPSWDPSGSYTLAFSDDFTGSSLNTSVWTAGWQATSGISGPINAATVPGTDGEAAAYNSTAVSVSGGYLNLALTATPITAGGVTYPYTGSCVTTDPATLGGGLGYQFTGGAIEVRSWLPESASGDLIANWPAIWLDGQTWPADGEIDIMEGLGGTAQWHCWSTANDPGVGAAAPGQGDGTDVAYFSPYAGGWHTYGVSWDPVNGQIDYYYDGVKVGSLRAGTTFDTPMYIILNNTTGWQSGPETAPVTMLVDWVRVWSPASALATIPPIGNLADGFGSPATMQTLWCASSEVTVTGGQAGIQCDTSYGGFLSSGTIYDLTGGQFYAKITNPSGSIETGMSLTDLTQGGTGSNQNTIDWYYNGSNLVASITQGGTATTVATLTYSATTHAWWRISESGGTLTWWTSTNGTTWTSRGTHTHTMAITGLWALIYTGNDGSGTLTTDVDNVNGGGVGGTAALAAASTLSAAGTNGTLGAATLAATGTLAAAGTLYTGPAAFLTGSATLTAAGTQRYTATLAATAALTASAGPAAGAAALSASSSLAASLSLVELFPFGTLGATAELDLNGTWTDISGYVDYDHQEITLVRGHADESTTASPGALTLALDNRDARFTGTNPAGPWYGQFGRNTPVRISLPAQATYLRLENDRTSACACPDATALHITGDIDIRVDLDISGVTSSTIASKFNNVAGNTAWIFFLNTDGTITFQWSDTGSDFNTAQSTVPIQMGRQCLRVTLDVNNGTGGHAVTFYTAAAGGVAGTSWTQLGSVLTVTGTTSIHAGTAKLTVGDWDPAAGQGATLNGSYFEFELRSGIGGTVVAHPVFGAQIAGASSFTDAQANTWTLYGTAELSSRDYRAHLAASAWTPSTDPTGTSVWMELQGSGVLRQIQQGTKPLQSAFRRALPSAVGLIGYWPCEDGNDMSGAGGSIGTPSQIASAIPGQPAGFYQGTPDFASDSSFVCSYPIINPNNARLMFNLEANATGTANVMRFLLSVPAGGDAATGALVSSMYTTGTVYRVDLLYYTGGALGLTGYDTSGNTLFTTGAIAFGVNGTPVWVSVELQQSGGNVQYSVVTLQPGAANGLTSGTPTITGTIGSGIKMLLVASANWASTGIGQLTYQNEWESLFDFGSQLDAYQGESAGTRFTRLCTENSIPYRIYGAPADTVIMGAQTPLSLMTLLQECADADRGQIFEPRTALALGYRTRASMQNQTPDAALDYSLDDLASFIEATEDDQYTVNDAVVTRAYTSTGGSGSSAEVAVTSGPLSTQAPPAGVGPYLTSATLNLNLDSQAQDLAGWLTNIGTATGPRYPGITYDLARDDIGTLLYSLPALDMGDRLTIGNFPAWLPPDGASQLVFQTTETIAEYVYKIKWVCVPELPYETAVYDDPVFATADTDGSTLASAATSTATSLSVATTTSGSPLWTVSGADLPFDLLIDGERMTVTAITGSSSPQTFTVTRSVNGVSVAHAAGATVDLFNPAIMSL